MLFSLLWLPIELPQAAPGDVIISRQVQSRVATRPTQVPDPHPRVVNASPTHYTPVSNLGAASLDGELSDHEFAQVSSGRALPTQLQNNQATTLGGANQTNHNSLQGSAATHGGAGSRLGGQVNRSLQQGLRPLQMLGGQ
ncbi:MAG: hypothetical protein K2X80_16275 [Pseudomonadaceae bacterium]|nr:hypothetical protein [Pseudomonadaceae bacterium]